MASSLRKAQLPLSCQLCDNANVIKWKCIDCVLLMCDNCKERIHPKFKSSEAHTIISIKDVGKEKENIPTLFGSLGISPTMISSVDSTYTTSFPAIGKMQYSSIDTIYCCYHLKESGHAFFNIRLLAESIEIIQNFDIECIDFGTDSKDNIYVGPFPGFELKMISPEGVTKNILSTSPMKIISIHINKNNELFLGLREQGPSFPVTKFCSRQVVVFDQKNNRKVTIEYDQKGKQLFSYVWRIVTDSCDNIFAVDHFNESNVGQIVAIETTGAEKFRYKGHLRVNTSKTPFTPMDIAVTKTNIIIVSDRENHSLHALNTKGELISLQTVTNLGVILPNSLCLNSEGLLLIGCKNSSIGAKNAKIHVAKISL